MFLQAGVAQAHRNRVEILHQRLQALSAQTRAAGRPLRVLNVGCGPAAELQRLVAGAQDIGPMDVVLMDFSEETLQYARQRIEEAAQAAGHGAPRLELRHESVHQLLKRSARDEAVSPQDQFDYIYCAGLFDYLADKACARLISYFESRLRPGGSLLVTNVHSFNPERYWMEHLMEWYLIYRNEEGICRLFPASLPNVHTYTDATNINLFAEVVKPA
jgi:extracellular factor (EF) 3-hydroxypalmitic acid methyl ester biosynthesis protein